MQIFSVLLSVVYVVFCVFVFVFVKNNTKHKSEKKKQQTNKPATRKNCLVFSLEIYLIAYVILQMLTSLLRWTPRWLWLVTHVALSKPSRTCVARTITDKTLKMQQSGGLLLSSAARGPPPLVCRRSEHAESATKCTQWYLQPDNKFESSQFVALLSFLFPVYAHEDWLILTYSVDDNSRLVVTVVL